jgi:hypothetical protein
MRGKLVRKYKADTGQTASRYSTTTWLKKIGFELRTVFSVQYRRLSAIHWQWTARVYLTLVRQDDHGNQDE